MLLTQPLASLKQYVLRLRASWHEFVNCMRVGSLSPQDVIRLLRQGPPSLGHIQLNKIIVVDHLGRNIPVPTIFCSAWEVMYDLQAHLPAHISCHARISALLSTGSAKIVPAINL